MKPFDLIDAASSGASDPFSADPEEAEAAYNPWLTNRHFSYFPDTVMYANAMNVHSDLPKRMQFAFYHGVLRKRKRFAKWQRMSEDQDVDTISKWYDIDKKTAREYVKIMGPSKVADVVSAVRSTENEAVSKKPGRDKTKRS